MYCIYHINLGTLMHATMVVMDRLCTPCGLMA